MLRPGGRLLCLEFSKVVVPGMQQLYDLYSFNVIPQIGRQACVWARARALKPETPCCCRAAAGGAGAGARSRFLPLPRTRARPLPAHRSSRRVVAGDAGSYQYLVESIRMFPDQEAWAGVSAQPGRQPGGSRRSAGHRRAAGAAAGQLASRSGRPAVWWLRVPRPARLARPSAPPAAQMIEAAGFRGVDYENLTFGVVAIHSGFKLA